MQTLIVYDIPNDRIRGKIADVCLDYGLDRIQWSAFLGDLARTHHDYYRKMFKQALYFGFKISSVVVHALNI